MITDTDQDETQVEAKWGDKSVTAKSKYAAEIIAFLSLTVTLLLCWGGWLHIQDTRDANAATVKALEKMTERSAEQNARTVSAIREQTCLSVLSDSEKKAEFQSPYGFCKRMSQ